MLKIGITGKIGSGKTTICRIFESIGVPVYYSDIEAKKFYNDSNVVKKVCALFGNEILDIDKNIDKKALASIVFNDKDKLLELNKIIHPLVIQDFENWCKNKTHCPYILFESAIIYESNLAHLFSKIIYIDCPEEIAVKRVMKRDNITHLSVLERMSKQGTTIPPYDFRIISNEKKLEIPQVLEIHNQILQLSNLDVGM
jgi:dephospho-CoA kinase